MIRAIDMGWYVLDKYYNKTGETPVYAAAILLDPRKRAAYLHQNWPEEWVEPAIELANTIWVNDFKPDIKPDSFPAPENAPGISAGQLDKPVNVFTLLKQKTKVKTISLKPDDNFRSFINGPAIDLNDGVTPLEWWCQSEQRRSFPGLSRMAMAILSIPAESSEPERTFSGARRTCSWDRLRLRCTTIEMIECIGNWIRQRHIKPVWDNGMGLPIEPELQETLLSVVDEGTGGIDWY
jgi:hypothetical protein